MYRLSREVRFAVNAGNGDAFSDRPTNGHGGYPSLAGLLGYLTVRVHFAGPLDPRTQYLLDIKTVDEAVRAGLPKIAAMLRQPDHSPADVVRTLFDHLRQQFGGLLVGLDCLPSPFVTWSVSELSMIRYSQKFEFSAAHRLHNPAMTDAENRAAFGKCNNPMGHGHNYELQVTLTGEPDATGRLVNVPEFESLVNATVIDRLDHKFLNHEVDEFRDTIPSVENIARVIYARLKLRVDMLASVTVWETPKTWCEYSE